MAGQVAYATTTDLGLYLDGVDTVANSTIMTTLLWYASRFIDRKCHRFFYDDGSSERWFDVPSSPSTITRLFLFRDFFSVTQLRILKTENNSITDPTQYDIIAGDGATPPSNWYAIPDNPDYAGSSTTPTVRRPFYGIALPTTQMANTTPPAKFVPGRRTVGVTANWGWPAVPDEVKNITLKMASRAFQSKSTGWTDMKGDPNIGVVHIGRHFDSEDMWLLQHSDLIADYPS